LNTGIVKQFKQFSHSMTSILQLALLALILVSFSLVVGVPVLFASPNGWGQSQGKRLVFFSLSIWILLVFLVGVFNSPRSLFRF
jgi:photosystem II PsbZ protein